MYQVQNAKKSLEIDFASFSDLFLSFSKKTFYNSENPYVQIGRKGDQSTLLYVGTHMYIHMCTYTLTYIYKWIGTKVSMY